MAYKTIKCNLYKKCTFCRERMYGLDLFRAISKMATTYLKKADDFEQRRETGPGRGEEHIPWYPTGCRCRHWLEALDGAQRCRAVETRFQAWKAQKVLGRGRKAAPGTVQQAGPGTVRQAGPGTVRQAGPGTVRQAGLGTVRQAGLFRRHKSPRIPSLRRSCCSRCHTSTDNRTQQVKEESWLSLCNSLTHCVQVVFLFFILHVKLCNKRKFMKSFKTIAKGSALCCLEVAAVPGAGIVVPALRGAHPTDRAAIHRRCRQAGYVKSTEFLKDIL